MTFRFVRLLHRLSKRISAGNPPGLAIVSLTVIAAGDREVSKSGRQD